MANEFTYQPAPHKYRCGNTYKNLTVLLFFGPASKSVPLLCAYCCNMNVDSDGDPQSYGPLYTPNIRPLDYLENAGWAEPDKEGPDFKHRGNKQRKAAYDKGIASARTEYEDLQKQRLALEPKAVEQKRKDLDQRIVDADKALNDLKQQTAAAQKIADADKALNDLKQQKAALDPDKVAKEKHDLEKNKIPAARKKIYELNRNYEFKPWPKPWKHELWRQELWQPGDTDKPMNLGKIFWDWYGLKSMTPADATATPPHPHTKTTPVLYNPSFLKNPGPIRYEMYEDVLGRFPVVQQGDEPGPGYFVSMLATPVNSFFPEWDQRSTVPPSARDVQPYGALGALLGREAMLKKRDTVLAMSCDTGTSLAFPFLDAGNDDALAECSWTAFTALGGTFGRKPGGQLYKTSEPLFLYLAFPHGQTPTAVLSQIGAFDNGDEFTTILAFLVQATFERSSKNPVQEYKYRKEHPELNQNPAITNLATAIDTNLRANGFALSPPVAAVMTAGGVRRG
jgi:hypothetical protein